MQQNHSDRRQRKHIAYRRSREWNRMWAHFPEHSGQRCAPERAASKVAAHVVALAPFFEHASEKSTERGNTPCKCFTSRGKVTGQYNQNITFFAKKTSRYSAIAYLVPMHVVMPAIAAAVLSAKILLRGTPGVRLNMSNAVITMPARF